MQLTQLSSVIVALSVALAVAGLLWRRRVRRLNRESPERQYRRDIQALQRLHRTRVTERSSDDLWSAAADPPHSRAKKAATWVAVGTLDGCGGCGGCGCGG
jgi:membrane protein implicated in regulation of membrane protease activity